MATTTLKITGMTCGHCVSSVEDQIGALDGVTGIEVDLNPDGVSTAVVTSDQDISAETFAAAVTEAGYQLAD